jgi:hypothetical protein
VPVFSAADALQHETNDFAIVDRCFFKAKTHESPACHPILDVKSVQSFHLARCYVVHCYGWGDRLL